MRTFSFFFFLRERKCKWCKNQSYWAYIVPLMEVIFGPLIVMFSVLKAAAAAAACWLVWISWEVSRGHLIRGVSRRRGGRLGSSGLYFRSQAERSCHWCETRSLSVPLRLLKGTLEWVDISWKDKLFEYCRRPSHLDPIHLRRRRHCWVVLSRRPCSGLTSLFHCAPQCHTDCTGSPFVLRPRPGYRKAFLVKQTQKSSKNQCKVVTKTYLALNSTVGSKIQ